MKRRAFLASFLAGTTTGCIDAAREAVLGVDVPEYSAWIPDTTTEFGYYDVPMIEAAVSVESGDYVPPTTFYGGSNAVSSDDVENVISLGDSIGEPGWMVVTGGFDADAVADELTSEGLSQTDERGGHRIFESQESSVAFGVSSDSIVQSDSGVNKVYSTVDARQDESQRLISDNSDFERLVGDLGTSAVVEGETAEQGGSVGEVARGRSMEFDGDIARTLIVFVFEDSVDAVNSESDVRSVVESEGLRDASVEVEATVVKAEGEVSLS